MGWTRFYAGDEVSVWWSSRDPDDRGVVTHAGKDVLRVRFPGEDEDRTFVPVPAYMARDNVYRLETSRGTCVIELASSKEML